jgi:hypothetical protein
MRIVALLCAYNEERFVQSCLAHLLAQGLEVYLLDNDSIDRTVEIAQHFLGKGLIAIERFPRAKIFDLRSILERKQQLAASLEADWFMHADLDEIRLPPKNFPTLAAALADADRNGFNGVNFLESTFIPTAEHPDHEHENFQQTMRWYYPFLPFFPHRLTAWKRQSAPVNLTSSGGHQVSFPSLRMSPEPFAMRHYLFLSVPHCIRKYAQRRHHPAAVERGWHSWRTCFDPSKIRLPSETELRAYNSDADLNPTRPRQNHFAACWVRDLAAARQ